MSAATQSEILGEGAFGKVYKGEYNGEEIAVKVINLHNAKEQEISMKEVDLLSKLDHPNIVKYKGGVLIRSPSVQLHIYMELCKGGDLQRAIDKQKASKQYFPEDRILGWFRDLVSAVQYLHSMNIIHRDIKPPNIMLHNDCIKIGDFGLAKLLHTRQDFLASVFGTYIYACPEILNNRVCTDKGDMWSLGCTLFQLAALDPPFPNLDYVAKFQNDRSRLVVQSSPVPPGPLSDVMLVKSGPSGIVGDCNINKSEVFLQKSIPNHCSDVLKTLVDMLLQFDPTKRPGSTVVLGYLRSRQVAAVTAAEGQGDLRVAGGELGAAEGPPAGPARRAICDPFVNAPADIESRNQRAYMMLVADMLARNNR